MAVLDSNSYGWVVCHETYINKVYSETKNGEDRVNYRFDPVLFGIFEPFKTNKNQQKDFNSEVKLIKTAYDSLYELYRTKVLCIKNESISSNCEAKRLANQFYNQSFRYPENSFLGENKDSEPITATVGDEKYLFPEKCAFYSYDVKDISSHLENKLFHFILMDPPWWNKFIRRKRKVNANSGYTMMYDNDLVHIPISHLLHDDGIIGIWCTSAPSHINAILTVLFPAWGIQFLSQWFWLKVTKLGKPICAFSHSLGKQPYERIIFGVKMNAIRKLPNPDNNKVFMSVPSAVHSHKPPLCELIKPHIPENANCLELFARYLLPQWTSYGNEVLKLQHFSLYNESNIDDQRVE